MQHISNNIRSVLVFNSPIIHDHHFSKIFGNIAKNPPKGLSQILFYLSGIVTWVFFSIRMNKPLARSFRYLA